MTSDSCRDVWGLPPARHSESTGQREPLDRAFRDAVDHLKGNLRVVAAQAAPADHELFDAQRARIYEAFQVARSQTDEARHTKAPVLCQLSVAIRNRANEHRYLDAFRLPDGCRCGQRRLSQACGQESKKDRRNHRVLPHGVRRRRV